MTRGRYRISSHIDPTAIRAVADQHPRLREFYRNVVSQAGGNEPRARALLDFMLRRMLDDFGDLHINDVFSRLDRIETLRDNVALILDHVLEGSELPKNLNVEQLGQFFNDLQNEMREVTKPRESVIGDQPLKLADDTGNYAHQLVGEFHAQEAGGPAAGRGAHLEPVDRMRARVQQLAPEQRSALGEAAERAPRELWQAIAADGESGRRAAVAKLREKLGSAFDEQRFRSLVEAIDEMGKARTRGLTGAEGRGRVDLDRIADPELRRTVEGDAWILQEVRSLEQLQDLWTAFRRQGRDPRGFRGYVRHEMMTYVRSVFGEHGAAFAVPDMEFLLKGPDIHTRRSGTDLVGIGVDGWVWILDDKSHRASSVSSVTALFENLVGNLRDDARQFREDVRRLRREVPGFQTDMRVLDGIERMQRAADEIDAHLSALPKEQRFQLASLARIDAILKRHEIKLRVTSAFGEVTAISRDLARIGIRVTPTGPSVPLP